MLRRRTKSGQASKKMKVWKYELQMSFLLADTIPRGTDSNVATVQNEGDEDFVELNATGGGNEENEKEETDGGEDKAENEQEGRSRIFRKRNRKLVKENEQDVDKVISFMKEKKQESKKLLGELDYFFASACESAKRLPRHL
ncbi:uncharacterized protein LOC116169097 [Photinus pyralis]|uniref:uncharacterized protein LOC116169097 n=1 Tax=Photinus pyralis TaxID=7054 RepID=UPI0012676B44|nr:uncharacterized protein LOC116169097 [Photinus pyralis]